MNWQHIETAPQNQWVLVHDNSPQEAVVTIGICRNGEWRSMTGWIFRPTHWMPLPEPPAA